MPHKLLLADDSVTIQRVIELTFADEDVQVAVVGDGKQAIDRIQAERPDIVLADIGMPGRDGYDVAAFVKSDPQFAHIPVVLLTGAFEPIDENRARSVGCDAVLVKPFEPQMVINRVKELLSKRRVAPVPERATMAPASLDLGTTSAPSPQSVHQKDGDSLEDYFDRLDAAFATLASSPAKPEVPEHVSAAEEVPGQELNTPPGRAPGDGHAGRAWDPDLTGEIGPGPQPNLAKVFAALLAAEQGHPVPEAAVTTAPVTISEATVEDIVRRVLAKMADDSMRHLVLETAERLVREEIERIKRG